MGAVSVRERHHHERGPGVVAARAAGRLAAGIRAARCRPPLAPLHDRRRVPPLLRLRRVVRARLSGSRGAVARGAAAHRVAVHARRARMADPVGQRALDSIHRGLRAREARGPSARHASPLASAVAQASPHDEPELVGRRGMSVLRRLGAIATSLPGRILISAGLLAIVALSIDWGDVADQLSDASWGLFALGTLMLVASY